MPIVSFAEGVDYHTHGSTFSSYVAPSRGSEQLCAWRLTVPAGAAGVAHRPTREEVILILTGRLSVALDGVTSGLSPGDVAVVPAGAELRVDGGDSECTAWVTTTPGLEAVLGDGTRLVPPWVL